MRRFTNWLHNGQPGGAQDAATTEDGAYTLLGAMSGIIAKNGGAKAWIPSESEWYKAAYYDPNQGRCWRGRLLDAGDPEQCDGRQHHRRGELGEL